MRGYGGFGAVTGNGDDGFKYSLRAEMKELD